MTLEFKLPSLGEKIEAAVIANVLVKAGDIVKKDQSVLELESDKAVIELPINVSGKIKTVHIKKGDKVKVGQLVFSLEADSTTTSMASSIPNKSVTIESPKIEKVDLSVTTKAVPLTDSKPSVNKSAPAPQEKIVMIQNSSTEVSNVAASPSVRRLAREIGVDLTQVRGSGTGGRVSEEDVKNYARQLSMSQGPKEVSVSSAPQASTTVHRPTNIGSLDVEAMSTIRQKTAVHMQQAWINIPHVTQFDKADITDLDKLRQRYSKKVEAQSGKLTVTAILLKVVASALKVFPKFNANIDMANNQIIYKKSYNIGVAVDTEHGLIVPVMHNVDQKNILDISRYLVQMSEKARTRKITPDDIQGGTFTITNLGGIGGTGFTPIVNAPEVAILGIARANIEPVYVEGEFKPRLMLPLALSYDHRLIDGADGARFLRWVVEALEKPFLISLEG